MPTPGGVAETFKKSPRARKTAIWISIVAVLGLGIYFAGPRISSKAKSYRARQLATQAELLIENEDWAAASHKIASAFEFNRMQPETWRAYARFLSRTGQGSQAMETRLRGVLARGLR